MPDHATESRSEGRDLQTGAAAAHRPHPTVVGLPRRDVRAKRPPALSFLLRVETVRRLARVASLLALDYVAVFGAVWLALALKYAIKGGGDVMTAYHGASDFVPFAYLVVVLLFAREDLYAERSRRPGLSRIVVALFQVTVVSLIYALAAGEKFDSYYIFYASLFFAVALVSGLRMLHLRATGAILERAGYRRRTLLVGSGTHAEEVADALAEAAASPVEVVGRLGPEPGSSNGLRSLGGLGELPRVLAEQRIQEVIIADPKFPQEQAVDLVDLCHQRGVSVHVAPTTMEILLSRAEFVPGQSVPLFTLKPPVFSGLDFMLKRTFDLVVSVALLVVLAPLLLAIALAVKLTSRGPVLYESLRPGMGGEPFGCLKFRTMEVDAEARQSELEDANEAPGALFKIRSDPRVTPVGRFLRRFSLDELPQLWNVLRGEMSLVGPRPLPLRDFERLEPWHRKRYGVLPGMTGLWQVSGRAELDFDDLVRLDFLYLEQWSVLLDLSILLKTVPAVIGRRGAY